MRRFYSFLLMLCCAIGAVSAAPESAGPAKKLPADGQPALYRFRNKRASDKYVTAVGDAITGADFKGSADLSQVWVVIPYSDGYNIMNAATGRYLGGEEYNTLTTTATKYYIRYKFAYEDINTDYYEVATDSKFQGKTLMNMSPEYNMATWTTNDQGSLWEMEEVYDVSMDQVMDHIKNNGPFARELKEGVYYRIQNTNYGLYLAQDDATMVCSEKDEKAFQQYWTVKSDGNGWQIRNLLTDAYIGQQTGISQRFPMQQAAATMYLAQTNNQWFTTWNITNTPGNITGMHCDAAKNVVLWYNDNASNAWGFEEVELDQEEIDAALGEMKTFKDLQANQAAIQTALDAIFTDKAATTLADSYAAMTDGQLKADKTYQSLPAALQEMVMKVKNNTWGLKSATPTDAVADGSYERFFRVNTYQPYSNHEAMATELKQSNPYGRLSNPTGIVARKGDIIYLFVNEDVPSGVKLQAEAVNVDGRNCGGNSTGNVTDLKKGLNLLRYNQDKMLFIFYQVESTKQILSKYPDQNIHIEGGEIYGTFDVTRGMKNQDWTNMLQAGLIQNFDILNLKSDHLVMVMRRESALDALEAARRSSGTDYTDVELLMYVWETIVANEESYQGLDSYAARYRNVWNAFSIDHSYMYASTYGTYYENGTLSSILNYYTMTHDPGSLWGPSHEMGHNHQNLINCVGCTEVSNNLFSNINVFEAGISNTRGTTPKRNFSYLADKTPWPGRDIWTQTKMYFQLYLYFHAQGVMPDFLPKLFIELRKDPMTMESTWETIEAEGEQKNCRVVYGKNDYLKFAEKCCKVAQMDLSEFFEAYGFFVPVEKRYVGDYADYVLTTTQTDINAAKRRMQRYAKKAGNIMFINDYAVQNPANPNNKFKAVPNADGLKKVYSNESQHYYGNEVTTGNHLLYGQTEDYQVTGDYYTISGSKITFNGKNYLGHKVYDADGNLIWAVANTEEEIPASIRSLFPDKVTVVAADQNMADVPCPYYKSGTSPIARVKVTLPTGASAYWNVNKNFDSCMPANAVAVVTSTTVNDEVLGTTNVVSKSGVAKQMTISGDQEMVIPQDFTAEVLTFTKKGTGFQALQLPFDVADTLTIEDNKLEKKDIVAAGEPVVTKGKVSINLQNAAVKAGEFKTRESGFALNAAGTAVEETTNLSPFTYCFSAAIDNITTGIEEILAAPGSVSGKMFDLSGRRVRDTKKSGLYIINGKKALVK